MSSSSHSVEEKSLTFKVGEQWFSVPINLIKDVMYTPKLTKVPLASSDVAGLINLRGHIVTAIYASTFLGMASPPPPRGMCVVLKDIDDDFYSFIVDRVYDIEGLKNENLEELLPTLEPLFGSISNGLYREPDRLIVSLDKDKVIERIRKH